MKKFIVANLLLCSMLMAAAQQATAFKSFFNQVAVPAFGAVLLDTLKNNTDKPIAFYPLYCAKTKEGNCNPATQHIFKNDSVFFSFLMQGNAKLSPDERRMRTAVKLATVIKNTLGSCSSPVVSTTDAKTQAVALNPVAVFLSAGSVSAVDFFLNTIISLNTLDTAFAAGNFNKANYTYYQLAEFTYNKKQVAIDPNPASHALLFAKDKNNYYSANDLAADTSVVNKAIASSGYKHQNAAGESLLKWYETTANYSMFFIGGKCQTEALQHLPTTPLSSEIVLPPGAAIVFSHTNDAIGIDTATAEGKTLFAEVIALYNKYNENEEDKVMQQLIKKLAKHAGIGTEQATGAVSAGKVSVYNGVQNYVPAAAYSAFPFHPVAQVILPAGYKPMPVSNKLTMPFFVLKSGQTLWQGQQADKNAETGVTFFSNDLLSTGETAQAFTIAINPAVINWFKGLSLQMNNGSGALVQSKSINK